MLRPQISQFWQLDEEVREQLRLARVIPTHLQKKKVGNSVSIGGFSFRIEVSSAYLNFEGLDELVLVMFDCFDVRDGGSIGRQKDDGGEKAEFGVVQREGVEAVAEVEERGDEVDLQERDKMVVETSPIEFWEPRPLHRT